MFSKGAVWMVRWVLGLLFFVGADRLMAATPPPNDLIENAIPVGMVGSLTNLSLQDATTTSTDPEYSTLLASVWFKFAPTVTAAGRFVTTAPGSTRIFEARTNGYFRVGLGTAAFTATAGKVYYVGLYNFLGDTSKLTLSFSFPTLLRTKPASIEGLKTGEGLELEYSSLESGAEFQSVRVTAVNADTGTNVIATGTALPWQFRWTNFVAGPVNISAEATTFSGELRRSATNRLDFAASNDLFAQAESLSPTGGKLVLRPISLTRESGEPGDFEFWGSMWYRWAPSVSGVAQLSMGSGPFVFFKGTTLESLVGVPVTNVAGSTMFQAPVTAGQTYYIAVYDKTTSLQELTYGVATMRFTSLTAVTGLKVPGLLELAVAPLPSDVRSVDYFAGTNLVGSSLEAPFSLAWTNVLTGPVTISAIAHTVSGQDSWSEKLTVFSTAINDDFDNAVGLPSDLTSLSLFSSGYLATMGPFETSAGIWWRWTPDRDGFAVIAPVESKVGLLVRSGAIVVAEDFERPVSFLVEAAKTYDILTVHVGDAPRGFHWTIQNSPLHLPAAMTGTEGGLVDFVPIRNADVANVARVDYLIGTEVIATGFPPLFTASWRPSGPGLFAVNARLTLTDGTQVAGGRANLSVKPMNDDFANATVIPWDATEYSGVASFFGSTLEPNEPSPNGFTSLWWQWSPAFRGKTTILDAGDYMELFVGDLNSVTNWNGVQRDIAGGIEFDAEPGKTYHFSFRRRPEAVTSPWTMRQETFTLNVPAHRQPIDLEVMNANTNEVFASATILVNGAPFAMVSAPDWKLAWSTNVPGKYLFAATATNSAGGVRITDPIEYWVGPTNDYFVDAVDLRIEAGSVVGGGTLGSASLESGEMLWYPQAVGSVWYRSVPQASGMHTISFTAGGANINERTSFYEGDSFEHLARLEPVYGERTIASRLVKGRVYYIAVTTVDRQPEPFSFSIIAPTINDLLEEAVVLTGNNPDFTGNTTSTDFEPQESAYLPGGVKGGSIWYQWTPSITGNAAITLETGAWPVGFYAVVGSNWTNAIPYYSFVSFPEPNRGTLMRVEAGTTYSFAVVATAGPVAGHIAVTPLEAPPNDFKRNAIFVGPTETRVVGGLWNTTLEIGERPGTANGAYFAGSIWYRWIAPSAGVFKYWLDGEAGYYSPGLHVLATPNGNDLNNELVVRAGDEFYLQVSGNVAAGVTVLNLQFTARVDPLNDRLADALPINALPYVVQGNIVWATREPGEPMGQYGDGGPQTIWWSYRATEEGVLSVQVAALPTFRWLPRLVAYRGTNMATLQYLTESWANISFPVAPGVEYRLQLQTVLNNGVPGDFELGAQFEPKPTNDLFANRTRLTNTVERVRSWMLSPTIEAGEPLVGTNVTGTLWWTWTAPTAGRLEIHSVQHMENQIAIYRGAAVDALQVLRTNAPGLFKVAAGETFEIQTYSITGGFEATAFDFYFLPFLPADNDDFADAAELDGAPKSNLGATREPGEPAHASGGPNKSLWWKVGAGENRSGAAIRLAQTSLSNLTIAIYQGQSVDTLRLIAKGAERVFFDLWAGETYYIAVETAEADTGDVTLDLYPGRPSGSRTIPGNLVGNPSFESQVTPVWTFFDVGGQVGGTAPDGGSFVTTWIGRFYQDIPTTPGAKYRLRFVFAPGAANEPAFTIHFGGTEVGSASAPRTGWRIGEFEVTATGTTSRLEFRGAGPGGSMDQISLVPLNDPPAILSEPVSLTLFEAAPGLFHAGISGVDPISRQWYFNNAPIPGATDGSLRFDHVAATNAGVYHVVATNAFGRAESAHVTLTVEGVTRLQIVLQPQGDEVFAGQYVVLQTAAVSGWPMQFQWFKDGTEIPAATNAALAVSSFAAGDEGSYTVRVFGATESALSLPARLRLATGAASGGGLIWFANAAGDFPPVIIPVFDVDGFTRVYGTNFVAQLYAGSAAEWLRPSGSPAPFDNRALGTWKSQTVTLANVPPGAEAFVQVRVWDATTAASYEAARALGGKFGRSAIMRVTAGETSPFPVIEAGTHLTALESFTLQAGLPNFVTGRLALLDQLPDGSTRWQLTGAAGFRYLIERSSNNEQWLPLAVLHNETGVVTFTDPIEPNSQGKFYRARMLD